MQSEQVMAVEEIIPDGLLIEAHRNCHNGGSLGANFLYLGLSPGTKIQEGQVHPSGKPTLLVFLKTLLS